MDHVENVGIEEIVEIIREFAKHFAKHGEEVVDKEKLQLRRVVMKW
jgi:nitrogenase molybdenum-iron protein alpha/beta subunit